MRTRRGNKGNARTDEGGDRNKDGRSEADDRNKEGDRNKAGDRNKGTIIKGNSYLLANPRPAEAPDNGTVVQTTGADHSAPGTQPEPNTHTQTLTSGAIQVVYQVQKGLHRLKRLFFGQASGSGNTHHGATKMYEGHKDRDKAGGSKGISDHGAKNKAKTDISNSLHGDSHHGTKNKVKTNIGNYMARTRLRQRAARMKPG